jgi:hypothetical protein
MWMILPQPLPRNLWLKLVQYPVLKLRVVTVALLTIGPVIVLSPRNPMDGNLSTIPATVVTIIPHPGRETILVDVTALVDAIALAPTLLALIVEIHLVTLLRKCLSNSVH